MAAETPEVLLVGRPSDAELNDQLISTVWTPRSRWWWALFALTALGSLLLVGSAGLTVAVGVGLWGINIPVAWAYAIVNFVWWIGIGHAGTFISAILLLLEQRWRTSINRVAEAMTLFAVMQAALFPLLHLGRPWFAYWLVPYPAETGVWPQFRSSLPWDAAAVFTYFTISLLFWYLGLLPDLAAVRDQAPTRRRRLVYGLLALGWRGSARAYTHYRVAYGLLAGLATPLVLSVHSIVSSDFAISILPGWHSTIFPPYFVAGAIFSGFAMVLTLMLPMRRAFHMENVITESHLDAMAKMLLATGWIVVYTYLLEAFFAWFSGESYEFYQQLVERPFGPGAAFFWASIFCNVIVLQVFWLRRARRSPLVLWIGAILINIGMWSERFVIVVQSLERDFLPTSWHAFRPTWVDLSLLAGTGCFFLLLFLLFLRLVPFIPASELKALRRELGAEDARPEPRRDSA
jgi:molybdopterin-containing oxidoreductase family membrane subunit